jgi:hypothetical protein
MPDIKNESKTAIGIAYINASNGPVASRVDWVSTLISLMGGAAQVRKDRFAMDIVTASRKKYLEAVEDCKLEHTQLDAIDKCMSILILLYPVIFETEQPYAKLDLKSFNPKSLPQEDKT